MSPSMKKKQISNPQDVPTMSKEDGEAVKVTILKILEMLDGWIEDDKTVEEEPPRHPMVARGYRQALQEVRDDINATYERLTRNDTPN